MKIPLSFLKSFLKTDLSPFEIGDTLTMLGIEVDRIENGTLSFAQVVVGEIRSAIPHPDAKNLQVAEVSDGKTSFTVVCGASNCRAGMKTAFAKEGALLTDRDGLQRRIEKTSIRGVVSNGMLCSASELGIPGNSEGILELPLEFPTGADAASLLWNPVFEISLTPNLGHCMSGLGIARELSAALQIPLQIESRPPFRGAVSQTPFIADFQLCPRYMCCLMKEVKIGPSPFQIRRELELCGQKGINHAVDATNYIMMKFGQPLHAFDMDRLEGGIRVGPAPSDLRFLGLDGIERNVPAGTLLISDAKKPLAIAGVIGGADSAVSETTTNILLEAAYFDPAAIRNSAKKIGLRTESSQRFEKGVDPEGVERALFEASFLIGGKIIGSSDQKQTSFPPKQIGYRPDRINRLLGTKISETEMEEIFERLGFKAGQGKAAVPFYRGDVGTETDLAEEVARIYGYQHIEKRAPLCSPSSIPNDPIFVFENGIRRRFAQLGLVEFLCCDLISPKCAELSRKITPPSMEFLKASYSKSEEYSILRTSLLPSLLESAGRNIAQKNHRLSAFEIGRIHFLQEGKPVEIPMGAILLSGKKDLPHWSEKSSDFDYFDLKGMIENLIDAAYIPSQHLALHPGRQADIYAADSIVGSLGEVHPSLLEPFGIEERVYYAELNLLHLMKMERTNIKTAPLSEFPSSERDWTLPLSLKTPVGAVFQAIEGVRSPLLESVRLVDLYIPEMGAEKRATFRFVYRDPLKTISFDEVEAEHGRITDPIAKLLAK